MSAFPATASFPAVATFPDASPLAVLLARFQAYAVGSNAPVGLFQDTACTTPALLTDAPVRAIKDVLGTSGLALINTNSTATLQFRGDGTPVVRLPGGLNSWLAVTVGSFPLTDHFILIKCRLTGSDTNISSGIVSLSVPASNDNTVPTGWVLEPDYCQGGAGKPKWCPSVPTVFRSHQIGGTAYSFTNGVLVQSDASDPATGTATMLGIGGRFFGGAILDGFYEAIDVECVLFGNGVTLPQAAAIEAALGVDVSAPLIVSVGDSLTDGMFDLAGSVAQSDTYPSQLQALRTGSVVINDGNYGDRISSLVSRAATTDAMWRAGAKLVVLIGTNDLDADDSGATVLANLASYITARQIVWGSNVWVGTIPDRQDQGGGQATFDAQRAIVNAGIASVYPGRVVDFAANPLIGNVGAANNSTYFQADLVHFKKPGHALNAVTANTTLP